MTLHAPFDIEVGRGLVSGSLHLPEASAPRPAVLVGCDLPGSVVDHTGLVDAVVTALNESGIAAVEFAPRLGETGASPSAADVLDDACAVLGWMRERDDLDPLRTGVLGCGLGAVVAAGLAGRTDRINRVCLLAPITAATALTRLDRPDDATPLLDAARVDDAYRRTIADLTPVEDLARHPRPTLLVGGAADRVVPPDAVKPYVEALERAGVPFGHERIALADHDCSEPSARALCVRRVERFFMQMVASPHEAAAAPASA